MSFQVPILLYWGGSVIEKEEGTCYDIGPKSCVVVSNTIKYAELYEKLNGNHHLAQGGNISHMICQLPGIVRPHHPVIYSSLVVEDDDTVEAMINIVSDGVFRQIELYLEFSGHVSEENAADEVIPTVGSFKSILSQVSEYATWSLPSILPHNMSSTPMQESAFSASAYGLPHFDMFQQCVGEENALPELVVRSPSVTRESYDYGMFDNIFSPSGRPGGHELPDEDIIDDGDASFECEEATGVEGSEQCGNSDDTEVPDVPHSTKLHQPMSNIFTRIDMEDIDGRNVDGDRSFMLGSEWDPLTHEPLVGLLFPNKESVKRSLQIYSVARNRRFSVQESEKSTMVLICKKQKEEKCKWRLRASCKIRRGNQWEITRYKGPHTCLYMVEGSAHSQMTSKFVAQLIEQQVKVNPELSIAEIILAVQAKSVTISRRKACIARNLAIQGVFGNWEESFNELPRFMAAMKRYNPGTVVVFDTLPTEKSEVVHFKYVFWSLSGSIEGFRHCRPVVAIDGTFLTGKYKGVLLIANSVDANNQIFPLAFAVVDKESEDSWAFFLKHLRSVVAKDRRGICLISDRGTSIKAAVGKRRNGWADQPYDVFHCHCIRHYKANFVKKFKSDTLGDLMMQAAKKHQIRKFEKVMEAIKSIDEAAERWLRVECPVQKWTLSHDGGRRHGQLTSNLVESFNSIVKGPRAFPITALVQCIFYKLSQFFALRYKKGCIAYEESEMAVTPAVHEQISDWQKKAGTHILQPHHLQQGIYTILTQRRPRGGGNVQTVRLADWYCSCGKWKIYQVPCSHVIAVCQTLGYDWKQYVGDELYVRSWKKCYEHTIMPIEHEDYWPESTGPTILPCVALRRGKGRPRKNRLKSDMDLLKRKRKP